MNDQKTSDEQPEKLPEELPEQDGSDATDAAPDHVAPPVPAYADLEAPGADAAENTGAGRRWLPSTPAGKSRLVAAGVAGAFLLVGGLGGYAIGQVGDDHHDRGGMVRPADFDGRGPGGPDGGMRGGPGDQQGQQGPGSTSGSGTAS